MRHLQFELLVIVSRDMILVDALDFNFNKVDYNLFVVKEIVFENPVLNYTYYIITDNHENAFFSFEINTTYDSICILYYVTQVLELLIYFQQKDSYKI